MEDDGDMFLQNIWSFLPIDTASHLRRSEHCVMLL